MPPRQLLWRRGAIYRHTPVPASAYAESRQPEGHLHRRRLKLVVELVNNPQATYICTSRLNVFFVYFPPIPECPAFPQLKPFFAPFSPYFETYFVKI